MAAKYVRENQLVLFVVSLIISESVLSAGFHIPESSVEGVALSDAMVANAELAGAFTYNYSSMLFSRTDYLSVDLIGIAVNSTVSPSTPNSQTGEIDNQASNSVIPSVYLTQKLSKQYTWGLHVGVPYGLETVWPANTFSQFQAADTAITAGGLVAGLHPQKSSIELLVISPSIGRKFNQHFAVAVGIDYYDVINVEMNSVSNQLNGDGNETGWNLSTQYHSGSWSLGASYHSSVDIKITGQANIFGAGFVSASTELGLPDRLQAGAGYEISDELFIEFNIERIGWSIYDRLIVTSTGGGMPSGTVFSVSENNWNDVVNYRMGITYDFDDDIKILSGIAYEEKAQQNDLFDASTPDADRALISFGVIKNISANWLFKAAYQYAKNKNRSITGQSYITQLATSGGADSDANGTDVYNGIYKGNVQFLALGVSRIF